MSLRRIAKELRVAPSTVSKVLNRYEDFSIREDLKQRILERARELNYTPNPVYQAMRMKNNRQICILLPCLLATTAVTDSSRGVDHLSNRLVENGFSFHYISRPTEHQQTFGLPPWKSGGAVVVDARIVAQIAELDESDTPYVSLNGAAGPRGTAILVDEKATMRRVWDYLTGLGHRRIGYINHYRAPELIAMPFGENHYSVPERTALYETFCREIGFEPVAESLDTAPSAEQTVEACLVRGCTAIIGYSLTPTLRALKFLRTRGLRVPEDISVMTFNNTELTELSHPALTAVDIPVLAMGGKAADILIKKYHDPNYAIGERRLFTGTVVERASTAPPPPAMASRS